MALTPGLIPLGNVPDSFSHHINTWSFPNIPDMTLLKLKRKYYKLEKENITNLS